MPVDLRIDDDRTDAQTLASTAAEAAPAVEFVPLDAVMALVRRDSRHEPHQYLEETKVPWGGE